MSQIYEEYIQKVLRNSKTEKQYVSYMDLLDKFEDLDVEAAQDILHTYALENFDSLQILYSLRCRKEGTYQYLNLLVSEEKLLEIMEDVEDFSKTYTVSSFDEDINVIMIAENEQGYCNFFAYKNITEIIDALQGIRKTIDFTLSENPVRADIRFNAIGNTKINSADKGQSKIQASQRQKNTEVKIRGN